VHELLALKAIGVEVGTPLMVMVAVIPEAKKLPLIGMSPPETPTIPIELITGGLFPVNTPVTGTLDTPSTMTTSASSPIPGALMVAVNAAVLVWLTPELVPLPNVAAMGHPDPRGGKLAALILTVFASVAGPLLGVTVPATGTPSQLYVSVVVPLRVDATVPFPLVTVQFRVDPGALATVVI